MVRLQIQLDPARHRDVKRRARRLGVSVAEVIRRCVDAQLQDDDTDGPEARAQRIMAAAGRHLDPDGRDDVARRHDAALAHAFGTTSQPLRPGRPGRHR